LKVDKNNFTCAIARTTNLLGDKWSLLILRDIILHKKCRFGEFIRSKEKIATNVLTNRLKFLVEEGFIRKLNPHGTKKSTKYIATDKGISSLPIVIEMYLFSIHTIDESSLNDNQLTLKNDLLENRFSFEKKRIREYTEFVKELEQSLLENAF